ncbi:MAG TPA: hypothetical protein VNB91_09635 [Jatrophihabitantaceae bacterium]|nr:hypothetical protein [Jatrophihabitantaceae bacterium]
MARHRLAGWGAADVVADRREALAVGQPPLPAVHLAREHVAVDRAEPRQVGLEVRAPPLHLPTVERDRFGGFSGILLGEPALGVVEPFLGQTFEEDVDEFVIGADALRGESAGQEQAVDPVDFVIVNELFEVGAAGAEAIPHLLPCVLPQLAGDEVDDEIDIAAFCVLGREPDSAIDACRHVVRFLQQRGEPLLQDRDDVDFGVGPGGLDRFDGGLGPGLVVTEVRRLIGEQFLHLGVGHRMLDRASGCYDIGHRSGQHQPSLAVASFGQPLEKDDLIREDVRLVAEDVVEPPQLLVKKAGRPSGWEDIGGCEFLDVSQGSVELSCPLLPPERLLGALGQLVHHGEPDRTGELDQVGVDRAEFEKCRQVGRPRVVLIQQPLLAVVYPQ